MITLHECAFAKVNLTLDVLCKRPDGYHDLKSVMQTISLCDEIEVDVDTGMDWVVKCTDKSIPCDESNLAWKAAKVYFAQSGMEPTGLEIRIDKRIPSQAGLGGGSADAAAVLRALNDHYGKRFTITELADIAAKVGSDVPFCTMGGTVMAEGRGERLRKLPDLPDCIFVVCKPDFPISTPALYRKLDESVIETRPDNDGIERALEGADILAVAERLCNVFDPVVSLDHPVMNEIKAIYRKFGALGVQMTGSGSAVFGIVPDMDCAESVCKGLKKICNQTFIAKPV